MSLLVELQDIIDDYPTISKHELVDYLERNFQGLDSSKGTREYDFGKILYWFSLRNLAVLIDDVKPNAEDFEDEEQGIKNIVYELEGHFLQK